MKARARHRIALTGVFVFLAISLPVRALGGVPEVNHLMVTDVTTRSFSVIWASSEASTCDLGVYEDLNGTVPVTGAIITPHPVESGNAAIATLAEDSGVMKVRVTGLSPNTTYYFQTITTSKSTPDVTYYLETAPFMSVTTESLTTRTYESGTDTLPFSNDVIIEACYLDDGVTPAEGTILLATTEGANFPLTAFVGDGVPAPNALIDLNNAFGRETHENMDCSQGENLTLLNFRGIAGNSIVTHEVPEDLSLCQIKPPYFGLKTGANFVSFQLEPGDTAPESVLGPLVDDDKVDVIWGKNEQGNWVFYDPDVPFKTLNDLHSSTGYWLYMKEEASWLVHGSFRTDPIPLQPGANLVGYRSIETVDVLTATTSIGGPSGPLDVIWGKNEQGDWVFYDPDVPFWTLDYIEPGKAFWVYVNEDSEW